MRAELCRRQLRQDPVQMTADALRLLAEKFNLTPCSGDPRAGEGQGRQAGVWCSQYRFWRPAPETQMGLSLRPPPQPDLYAPDASKAETGRQHPSCPVGFHRAAFHRR
jgi:hypothetical protein